MPGIGVLTHVRTLEPVMIAGEETEAFFASPDLGLIMIRPARKDETTFAPVPELAAPAG